MKLPSEKQPLAWCDLNPDRIWRAPTPKPEVPERIEESPKTPDRPSMMRLVHNTSCISLSALDQQPSGSSAIIYPPIPRPARRASPSEEDRLLANMQNVSIFSAHDMDLASLGITAVNAAPANPWQPKQTNSFGTASTNGFTGSDTSSAPMSPVSSPGLRQNGPRAGVQQQQQTTHQKNYNNKNQGGHFRNNRLCAHHNSSNGQQYQNQRYNNGASGQAPNSRVVHMEYKPGMRDLGYWLKKLRLHKYAPLFEDMTYRQLLGLNNASLERMRVTNGARKKIAQSIEKLHERPGLLRSIEQKLKSGKQCVRCAICSIRQLLWSPFIKYDGAGRKTSIDIIDGFNVPSQMISDDNLPALIFRVIEILNTMVFPLCKGLLDLEDEYQLTMFHMFESVMKNESFTQAQQRRAFVMKKNARLYANPEDLRRHRMGMVSSSQCEGCHHAEVVNRERMMELQDRHVRQSRGDSVGHPTLSSCSVLLDLTASNPQARLEFNIPPVTPSQRIQKRPAAVEDEDWLATTGSPKISSSVASESTLIERFIETQMNSGDFWANADAIWAPSTSFVVLPEYRNPEVEKKPTNAAVIIQQSTPDFKEFNEPTYNFLRMLSAGDRDQDQDQDHEEPLVISKEPSLSDFNFPESVSSSSKKANSTGSYSCSESDMSIITSPPRVSSPTSAETSEEEASRINQMLTALLSQ